MSAAEPLRRDGVTILHGDCRDRLQEIEAGSVQCIVTSPPYLGMRSYGTEAQIWGGDRACLHDWATERYYREGGNSESSALAFSEPGAANSERLHDTRWRDDTTCRRCGAWRGELGQERTIAAYVAHMVEVCAVLWRVLADDGVFWLNLGDGYASDGKWGGTTGGKHAKALHGEDIGRQRMATGLRPKSLMGIPWRVALALQDAGWILRQDCIWHKPNVMPESVTDRPTRNHEYLFMLVKSERYFYDAAAIAEPAGPFKPAGPQSRMDNDRDPAHGTKKQDAVGNRRYAGFNERWNNREPATTRNKRTVWTVAPRPYADAHFATYPPQLIEPCILAGSRAGDLVLDPFAGSGTTLAVAVKHRRRAVGIELNREYAALIEKRLSGVQVTLPLEDTV